MKPVYDTTLNKCVIYVDSSVTDTVTMISLRIDQTKTLLRLWPQWNKKRHSCRLWWYIKMTINSTL